MQSSSWVSRFREYTAAKLVTRVFLQGYGSDKTLGESNVHSLFSEVLGEMKDVEVHPARATDSDQFRGTALSLTARTVSVVRGSVPTKVRKLVVSPLRRCCVSKECRAKAAHFGQ